MQSKEVPREVVNGWLMLAVLVLVFLLLCAAAALLRTLQGSELAVFIVAYVLALALWGFMLAGFFTLQPNMAAVLVLFGKYQGTVRTSGWNWANPLLKKIKVSLRARNLNGQRIKVNDLRGNPIEIAAVVVWRVEDTACAVFDVDHFEEYVSVQSEAALRHMASNYSYDTFETDDLSLRGNMEEVSAALQKELQERVARAGVEIEEARLSHLAYAPEIAGAMLQRQQADAIVAARAYCRWRDRHGTDGVGTARRRPASRSRRGAQSRHGEQPAGCAVRRKRRPAGGQRRHSLHLMQIEN